jgi:hypothetical protein
MSATPVSTAGGAQSPQPCPAGKAAAKPRPASRPKPQTTVSREAQRVAAAVLEVLAGVRTPTEAAVALSLSVPRYYLWEQRALEGLVRACEPRVKGKAASERHQMASLQKEVQRLRQESARQQALVRASQRTIGLGGPPQQSAKPAAKPTGKVIAKPGGTTAGKAKRKRRPVARALAAAAALQVGPVESQTSADSSSAIMADVVQRSVASNPLARGEAALAVPALPES